MKRGEELLSLEVQCEPPLDRRELETILTKSLQALFGEWETHSSAVKVMDLHEHEHKHEPKQGTSSTFRVDCPLASVGYIRCGLAMVTTPAYLDHTVYRFDVVDVSNGQ